MISYTIEGGGGWHARMYVYSYQYKYIRRVFGLSVKNVMFVIYPCKLIQILQILPFVCENAKKMN